MNDFQRGDRAAGTRDRQAGVMRAWNQSARNPGTGGPWAAPGTGRLSAPGLTKPTTVSRQQPANSDAERLGIKFRRHDPPSLATDTPGDLIVVALVRDIGRNRNLHGPRGICLGRIA